MGGKKGNRAKKVEFLIEKKTPEKNPKFGREKKERRVRGEGVKIEGARCN